MSFFHWEHYQLNQKPVSISSGGNQGQIFFGYDNKKKRNIVVKKRKPVPKADLEAQVMKEYGRHGNLVEFYDYFTYKSYGYIVMERLYGEHLLYQKRETKEVVTIICQILQGLHYLHRVGYLHLDILPTNILIQKDLVTIIDFGNAKKKENEVYVPLKGENMGRSVYKPPEKDPSYEGAIDNSWDLYSTACLGVYLLTGRPHSQKNLAGKMIKEKRLKEILLKALAKDPPKRYHKAKDFIEDLGAI